MKREEMLSAARRVLWQGWMSSSEEIGSQAALSLDGVGMLVEPGGAAELERLRGENERLRGELLLASTLLGDVSLLVEQARALDDTVLDVDAVAERAGVVEPEPDEITRLFVPVQALREPDEHGLRHTYRLGRDLPAQTTTPNGDPR